MSSELSLGSFTLIINYIEFTYMFDPHFTLSPRLHRLFSALSRPDFDICQLPSFLDKRYENPPKSSLTPGSNGLTDPSSHPQIRNTTRMFFPIATLWISYSQPLLLRRHSNFSRSNLGLGECGGLLFGRLMEED